MCHLPAKSNQQASQKSQKSHLLVGGLSLYDAGIILPEIERQYVRQVIFEWI